MRAYRAADVNKDGRIGSREFALLLKFLIFFKDSWSRFEDIERAHGRRLSADDFRAGERTSARSHPRPS